LKIPGILDYLERHGFGIDEQKPGRPAEPGIHFRVQIFTLRTDGYSHLF
jgi:hypothetical protein